MLDLPSPQDWVKHAPPSPRVERLEAFFSAHGFDPHRHDTYAIGRTLAGVQSFSYRGASRHSLPGEILVLHPDEVHDGHAGSASGFRYRMLYLTPALVQEVLGGQPLPFLKGGISRDPRLAAATHAMLASMDDRLDPLEEDDALLGLVSALQAVCGRRHQGRPTTTPPPGVPASTWMTAWSSPSPWMTWPPAPTATAGACPRTFAPTSAPAPTAT